MREQAKASTKEEAKMLLDEGTRLVQSKKIGKSLQPKDGPKPKRTAPSPKTAGKDEYSMTFMEKVRAGFISDPLYAVDILIEMWHGESISKELHEYLGMTWEEYQEFVQTPVRFFRNQVPKKNVPPDIEVPYGEDTLSLTKYLQKQVGIFNLHYHNSREAILFRAGVRLLRILIERKFLTVDDVKYLFDASKR